MANIKLKTLTFSNLFSYGSDNTINFSDNKITQLTAPNGSGKTSIAMILQETLFNKNIKLSSDNIRRNVNISADSNVNFSEDTLEKYTLVNFFASWCTPCRAEHHLFFEIKKNYPNVFLLGISHKDAPEDSKKYLSEEGNPYSFVGLDQDGRIALEFGVFGLPETFIVNNKGKIIFKQMGPLTEKILNDEISKLF